MCKKIRQWVCHWCSAWRHGCVRQAIGSASEVPAPRGAWRQGAVRQAIDPATVGLEVIGAQRPEVNRQAIWTGFAWRRLGLRQAIILQTMTCVCCV